MTFLRTSREATPDPFIGTLLKGRYAVTQKLAQGGWSAVYLGTDRQERTSVIVKRAGHSKFPQLAQRFLEQEITVLKLLAGATGIVKLYDEDIIETTRLAVIEYAGNRCLESIIGTLRTDLWRDVSKILIRLCEAIAAAHAREVIHRDLKPANIMLQSRNVVLVDFGTALMNGRPDPFTGYIVGSPRYMAPEQIRGADMDYRTDLYSLGSILYYAGFGVPLFQNLKGEEMQKAQCRSNPDFGILLGSRMPAGLKGVIMRSLEKEPGARFQTAEELRTALAAL